MSAPPDQALVKSFMPTRGGLTAGSARIRDDGDVPILMLCTESETLNNYPVRQPDTDTFRFWEMAGTAHAAGAGIDLSSGIDGIDLMRGVPDIPTNTVPWDYISDAAMRHLVSWVEWGAAPPSFPPIDVTPGPSPAIQRDEWGIATGGLRLPDVAAATGRHRGSNAGGAAASLMGETIPLSREELAARYRDRASYLRCWDAAIDDLVAAGLEIRNDVGSLRSRGRAIADPLFGA